MCVVSRPTSHRRQSRGRVPCRGLNSTEPPNPAPGPAHPLTARSSPPGSLAALLRGPELAVDDDELPGQLVTADVEPPDREPGVIPPTAMEPGTMPRRIGPIGETSAKCFTARCPPLPRYGPRLIAEVTRRSLAPGRTSSRS